jgi:hypothetical protein
VTARLRAHAVEAFAEVADEFGPGKAREKLRLLDSIGPIARLSPRRLGRLHGALYFLRAYPDNRSVLDAVRSTIPELREAVERSTAEDPFHPGFLNTGLPGSVNAYCYSYAVLQQLVELHPGSIEIDWDANFDSAPLSDAMLLALARGEMRGLEDGYVDLPEWLAHSRANPDQTDLEVVLRLLRTSTLHPEVQKHVFESCNVPVVYSLNSAQYGPLVTGAARSIALFRDTETAYLACYSLANDALSGQLKITSLG